MTYRELYEYGAEKLRSKEIAEHDLDARLLLEKICDIDRNTLLVHGNRAPSAEEEAAYLEAIQRRAEHIPLQHILGEQEFMGLTFAVNEHVLVPRQDTEILVEEALRDLHDGMSILDLCTGSGCILLSLLHYSNDCLGVGTDISEKALEVARGNSQRLNLKAEFLESDLYEKVVGKYDMIVSNPPYIPTSVIEGLMSEVKDHDPILALDGGEDGLCFYRNIIRKASDYLYGSGMLIVEIGHDQGAQVQALFEDNGFTNISVIKDYAGLDRVVKGYKHV